MQSHGARKLPGTHIYIYKHFICTGACPKIYDDLGEKLNHFRRESPPQNQQPKRKICWRHDGGYQGNQKAFQTPNFKKLPMSALMIDWRNQVVASSHLKSTSPIGYRIQVIRGGNKNKESSIKYTYSQCVSKLPHAETSSPLPNWVSLTSPSALEHRHLGAFA